MGRGNTWLGCNQSKHDEYTENRDKSRQELGEKERELKSTTEKKAFESADCFRADESRCQPNGERRGHLQAQPNFVPTSPLS